MKFFSKKSLTPQQLSAFTAAIISVPITIGIFIFKPDVLIAVISLVVIFSGSYGLILYTLQNFIYRKIKLIYKLIYQTKATKREAFYNKYILPQKSIDEVRKDVETWALQRNSEVELLRRNEEFRKEFLQNLSHEIKTPVFAIQGYIETLLDGAINDKNVNEKFLKSAAGNIERLVNLLEDLDKISKLESGELNLSKIKFVIGDLVKEIFSNFELKASEKKIKLNVKKDCDFPFVVLADREKIGQVLSNLVANAIKYGRENGSVEASFYNVEGKNILIEISDDGYGIAESQLNRVFERFYRTDNARTRKEGGSGLGLSICKHILEAHGESLHVRSKIDVGTTFGFSLKVEEF
ncbi:MAG: sensor histidine kinase [Bacteroidetes bacterium]|nr:sensor histidine kinase [Bacteroidota bacterium]